VFGISLDRIAFLYPEEVQGFYSSAVKSRVTALKKSKLATFPDILVIAVKRFVVGEGWVPKKLDVFIDVPEELDINYIRGTGLQPGEHALQDDDESPNSAPEVKAKEEIVSQLMDMGFPRERCVKAAIITNNQGADTAMNWVLEHMDDPDIDVPIQPKKEIKKGQKSAPPVDQESVALLVSMGFSQAHALKALSNTDNNVERAADWLFNHPELDAMELEDASATSKQPASEGVNDGNGRYHLLGFISHMGPNTSCGHYVCHIRKEGKWIVFNDRKVALSEDPPKELGYIYFYERT